MKLEPHDHLERLRLGIEAFARRDLPAIAEYFDENVLWHYVGKGPLVGDYRGVDEVFMFFAKRAALSGDSFKIEVQQAMADDTFISTFARASAKRDGVEYITTLAVLYRVIEGRVVEAWTIPADAEAEARFYGG